MGEVLVIHTDVFAAQCAQEHIWASKPQHRLHALLPFCTCKAANYSGTRVMTTQGKSLKVPKFGGSGLPVHSVNLAVAQHDEA